MVHTQSAGGVVLNKKNQVLVVNQYHRSWSFPKGHIEKGENSLDAAKREIYEESSINDLTYIRNLGSYSRPSMHDHSEIKHIFMFLFRTSQTKLKPIDSHNPEARWVDKNKVADLLTSEKDKKFFLSIINEI